MLSPIEIVVIPHGESERIVAKSLQSNLRLGMHIHRCPSSIQIAGLSKEMSTGSFKSFDALYREQERLFVKKGKPGEFTIFTIMDTDDCSDRMFDEYISRNLCRESVFFERITPVFCRPNLDIVMKKMGYDINPRYKTKSYRKCFPGNHDSIDDAQEMLVRAKACPDTNIELFIERCIEKAKNNRYIR